MYLYGMHLYGLLGQILPIILARCGPCNVLGVPSAYLQSHIDKVNHENSSIDPCLADRKRIERFAGAIWS